MQDTYKNIVTFSQLGRHGEFGNQLFQIAATIGYAKKHGLDFVFPSWECQKSTLSYSNFFKKQIPQDNALIKNTFFNLYLEPNFKYGEIPFYENRNIDICGYFQSEKYFKNAEKEIIEYFQPNEDLYSRISKIDYKNSVGLQLRSYDSIRPNYPENASKQSDPNNGHLYYYTLEENIEFVEKAVSYFGNNKTYYVSSNNWGKAKELFKHLKGLVFMEEYSAMERFFIQTLCEHNIITNSTFGWWGAWLNQNPDKKIFAPSKWFRHDYKSQDQASTLIPEEWTVI